MTTGAIITAIATETGKVSVPSTNVTTTMDTTTRARILNAVNRRYRRLLSFPGAQHLREATTSLGPTVAGTALYAVASVAKVNRIWDTTNNWRLQPMSLEQYRAIDPDPAETTGTPSHFVWAGYDSTRQWQAYLWPTPDAVITYTCDVTAVITDLSLDADVPRIPDDFHDILVLAGLVEEYRRLDDTRAAFVLGDLTQRESDLKYWLAETASGSTDFGVEPPSQLGAWFPSGT
jgi:hypothetical protein